MAWQGEVKEARLGHQRNSMPGTDTTPSEADEEDVNPSGCTSKVRRGTRVHDQDQSGLEALPWIGRRRRSRAWEYEKGQHQQQQQHKQNDQQIWWNGRTVHLAKFMSRTFKKLQDDESNFVLFNYK